MKAALLLAALAFTSCTTAGEAGPVEMQTIARGAYGVENTERKAVLATTEADYQRQWATLIGEGEIPPVDFGKHVVVFLLAGQRNTGGFSVQPVSARVEADGTAVIDAKVQGPPPGGMTTQALTYPYAVVTLGSRDVTKVRW